MNHPPPTTSMRRYLVVWVSLMFLLFLTWAVARLNLAPFNLIVALGIAFFKVILVVLYFMHVRHSTPMTRLFVSAALAWLLILFALTMSDYVTRGFAASDP